MKLFLIIKYFINIGSIIKTQDQAIFSSVTNREQKSDYEFYFKLQNEVPKGGYILVIFPSQFLIGLGILSIPKCEPQCQITERTVRFNFDIDLLPNLNMKVKIFDILNPSNSYGTGNFILKSGKGANIIDVNYIFGSIGISNYVNNLNSVSISKDNNGSNKAGEITKYIFSFKTSFFISKDISLLLKIPLNTFEISNNPSCLSVPINGITITGDFICNYSNGEIIVNGFNQDLKEGSEFGISIPMKNPKVSTITGTFDIIILRKNTRNILARKLNINGLPITPGLITQIVLSPLNSLFLINRKKRMWFSLAFKLRNPLPNESYILLSFPTNFQLIQIMELNRPISFYIEEGLEDIDHNNEAKIEKITMNGIEHLKLSKFKEQNIPRNIIVKFLTITPINSGQTSSVEIRSYTKDNIIIDNDLSNAFLNILNIPSALNTNVVISPNSIADGVSLLNLEFQITSSVPIPANGYFEILFDNQINLVNIDNTKCLVYNSFPTVGYVNSQNCYKIDKKVFIQINSTEYTLGVPLKFYLNQGISSPSLAGRYYLQVNCLSADKTVLQSFSIELNFSALNISGITNKILSRHYNDLTVLDLGLQTPYYLIESKQTSNLKETVSLIYLEFSTVSGTNILNDLGIGVTQEGPISCKSILGLIPIKGSSITCILTPQANPLIKITNYQTVQKNESIRILLPKIVNQNGVFSITIKLVNKLNRILRVLSSSMTTITSNTVSTGINGSQTLQNYFFTPNDKKINQIFNLEFELKITHNFLDGDFVIINLPLYDIGYISEENKITVKIKDFPLLCYQFQFIDWVICENKTGNLINILNTNSRIKINNLRWPRYQNLFDNTNFDVKWSFIGNDGIRKYYIQYRSWQPPNFYSFKLPIVNLDKKRKGEVDVTYTIIYICETNIPDNSKITITLPTDFNLLASSPPIKIDFPNFEDLSTTQKKKITFTLNEIVVENIKGYPFNTPFNLIIRGVKNPNTDLNMNNWTIKAEIADNRRTNNLIAIRNWLPDLYFRNDFIPGVVTIHEIMIFPKNVDIVAKYVFKFELQTKLSSGGFINIKFPIEYTGLPNNLECFIQGGLNTFNYCKRNINEVIIELDQDYITDVITLEITGILNPKIINDYFEIYTQYDGIRVDETKSDSLDQRKVNLFQKPSLIKIKHFSFDPINEAEKSKYLFKFKPINNITSKEEIYIIFPNTYDIKLGYFVEYKIISGLKGDVKFRIDNRRVIIYNFNDYNISFDSDIYIEIYGVINPNKPTSGNAGYIAIGVLKKSEIYMIDYNSESGLIEPENSPNILNFENIIFKNFFSRIENSFTLNLNLIDSIPNNKRKGALLFDLSEDFESNNININCNSSKITNILCYQEKKRIFITNFSRSLVNQYDFFVKGFINPLEELTTSSLIINTYIGQTKKIISRTYANINPIILKYVFPGPIFIINDNKSLFVERGSQSNDYKIRLTKICALNLTIQSLTQGFEIVPNKIIFNIGDIEKTFRVSVPESFNEGDYYINWKINGDLNPPIYTPVKKVLVSITKKKNIPIHIGDVYDLPFGGGSLDIIFTLPFGPNIGFEIKVTEKSNYKGLQLSKRAVEFLGGQKSSYISMDFNNIIEASKENLQGGELILEIQGVNKDIYTIPKNILRFNIIAKTTQTPEVREIKLTNFNKISATIFFSTSEISVAYYVIALKGTIQPDVKEVEELGPPATKTTEKKYGRLMILKDLKGEISIKNLRAQTDYVVYIFLKNRQKKYSEAPGYLEFKTSPRHSAAYVSLQFLRSYINSAERLQIFERISFLLSLETKKIIAKKYNLELIKITNARLLQSNINNLTILDFYILPDENSEVYPKPLDLAKQLNGLKNDIKKTFSSFDETKDIKPLEVIKKEVPFSSNPNIIEITFSTLKLNIKLSDYGFVYAVAIKKSEDLGKPTSYQIFRGYDNRNFLKNNGFVEISLKFVDFNLVINNLSANTDYNVYLTTGSAHPGFPDLLNDNSVISLEFKTKVAKIRPILSLNKNKILEFIKILFLIIYN